MHIHTIYSKWILASAVLLMTHSAISQYNPKPVKTGVEMLKGTWFAGGTLSTGSREADNESQLFAFVVSQRNRDFEVSLDAGYLFKDKLAAGLGLLYGRTKEESTTKNSDGILTDKRVAGDYYAFRPFIKNFLPLGKSNQFYVVIPTELQIGFGNKVTESVTDLVLTRTYTSTNYYGIAMRPGILAFIHRNFGFQVSVGAFGLSSSTEKSKTTNQPDSRVKTQDLDLKINLLSLSLGFTGYF